MPAGFFIPLDAETAARLERLDLVPVILERLNTMEANLSREIGEMEAKVTEFIDFVTAEVGAIKVQLADAVALADVAGQQAAATRLDSLQTKLEEAKTIFAAPAPAPDPGGDPTDPNAPPPAG